MLCCFSFFFFVCFVHDFGLVVTCISATNKMVILYSLKLLLNRSFDRLKRVKFEFKSIQCHFWYVNKALLSSNGMKRKKMSHETLVENMCGWQRLDKPAHSLSLVRPTAVCIIFLGTIGFPMKETLNPVILNRHKQTMRLINFFTKRLIPIYIIL